MDDITKVEFYLQLDTYKKGLVTGNKRIVEATMNNIVELLYSKYVTPITTGVPKKYLITRCDVFRCFNATADAAAVFPAIKTLSRALGCDSFIVNSAKYPQILGEAELLILVEELLEATFETIALKELDCDKVVKLVSSLKISLQLRVLYFNKLAKFAKIKDILNVLPEYEEHTVEPNIIRIKAVIVRFDESHKKAETYLPF